MGAWARLAGRIDTVVSAVHRWDERMMLAISRSAWLKPLSRFFLISTYLGDGYLWGTLGLALILFGRPIDRWYVLIGLGVSIVNVFVFRFLKLLFGRQRPVSIEGELRSRMIDTYSFPSGHATTSFGLAWVVSTAYPHPGVQAAVYLAATSIAVSRVYLREHYLLDVVVGAALGTFVAAYLFPFFKWLFF